MRRYTRDDEDRIRMQALVREWAGAGLIDAPQRARLDADLHVDLRRTNSFLRAVLALFTALVVWAFVLLLNEMHLFTMVHSSTVMLWSVGIACCVLAEFLAGACRLYRFGVEEALAVASVVLFSAGAMALFDGTTMHFTDTPIVVGLLLASAGGLALFRRFGFEYAGVGAMACAAFVPFEMDLSAAIRHFAAALILALTFLGIRWAGERDKAGRWTEVNELLQAAAFVGVYLALNVQLTKDLHSGTVYWLTYVATWILPPAGLALAIRDRSRALLDASILAALATLATNKPYLDWPHRTWDPILLGVLLIAMAISLRRWLSTGPDGERSGWTAAPLTGRNSAVFTVLRVASAGFQPTVHVAPVDHGTFGGGESGGGGAGASF